MSSSIYDFHLLIVLLLVVWISLLNYWDPAQNLLLVTTFLSFCKNKFSWRYWSNLNDSLPSYIEKEPCMYSIKIKPWLFLYSYYITKYALPFFLVVISKSMSIYWVPASEGKGTCVSYEFPMEVVMYFSCDRCSVHVYLLIIICSEVSPYRVLLEGHKGKESRKRTMSLTCAEGLRSIFLFNELVILF